MEIYIQVDNQQKNKSFDHNLKNLEVSLLYVIL